MAFNVDMKSIKREGVIKSLWELVRILNIVLAPNRDRENGKQILPLCLLISKMFSSFCVCRSNFSEAYFVRYSKYVYDVERIIDCVQPEILTSEIREYIKSDEGIMAYINDIPSAWRDFTYIPNDLEYALVDEDNYDDYESINNDILLQDKELNLFYNEIVTRISDHLKSFKFRKYDKNGYDVFGYNREGKDVNGYDSNGLSGLEEEIEETISQEINDKFMRDAEEYYKELSNQNYNFGYNSYKDTSEPEILSLESDAFLYYDEEGNVCYELSHDKRGRKGDDYDINYDDLESDYYDSSSYDDPEDPDSYYYEGHRYDEVVDN